MWVSRTPMEDRVAEVVFQDRDRDFPPGLCQ